MPSFLMCSNCRDLERNLLEERHHRQTAEYARDAELQMRERADDTIKELRKAIKEQRKNLDEQRETIMEQRITFGKQLETIKQLHETNKELRDAMKKEIEANEDHRKTIEHQQDLIDKGIKSNEIQQRMIQDLQRELPALRHQLRQQQVQNHSDMDNLRLERADARAEEDKRVKTEITFHHSKEKNLKRTISRGERTREISVKASDTVVVPGVVDEARLKIDSALDAAGLRDEVAIRYLRRGIKYDKHEGVDEIVFDSLDEVVASHRASSSDKYCKASTYLLLNDVLVTPVWQFEVV
ncbi:hypothetical protein PHYSODRAFT_262281 [Phytophthora sojae]|uniref:Uncharacterized protein n=1 Tax=Phytophthora sojae (strain P6497) TaxID=1094619 RepID=G5AIH3_PHYSP|nr:hypothetical protein PHYSODRAFT_262281 [Phytophthora sojae]EGZ04674.1 hypothetical protein PHYSODRAFT_262281 [Phytophthora sojae]|eukprot:XP_009539874.1 hypothetical protein PHYSODRAFT_262281 [Phytophthora sojae]